MLTESLVLLFNPLLETLYMVCLSTAVASIFGLPLGLLLYVTSYRGLLAHQPSYWSVSIVTNAVRSIPYIILMIAIIPFTRLLVGSSIGTNAAVVSLTIAAIPFIARIVENALGEVPAGLIEAGHSMGATPLQVIHHFLLPEAMPAIINGLTLTMINLVGYSAMAGAIGGGGLGDLAIRYGYQRFNTSVMLLTILVLIFLVQLIQVTGDRLAKRFDHR